MLCEPWLMASVILLKRQILDTPLKCLWSQDSKVNLHTINEGGLFSIISLLMFMLFPIMMDRFIDWTYQRGLLLYEH